MSAPRKRPGEGAAGRPAWAGHRGHGLGGRQSLGRRPCLVIVDFTYGFTDPASPLHCDSDDAVAATAVLLDLARRHGHPRVFTTIGYDAADREIAKAFLEKVPALASVTLDSRWAQVDGRIAPQPGEPVLRKLFASAFFGVPLAPLLAAHGCDSLVVCGASTSGCVRATVVDAVQHGYRAMAVRAGVADRAHDPAEAALADIQAKYGEVVSLPEACSALGPPP